jgi:hypothetical protein
MQKYFIILKKICAEGFLLTWNVLAPGPAGYTIFLLLNKTECM